MTPDPQLERLIEYHREAYQAAESHFMQESISNENDTNLDIEAHFAYMAVLEALQTIETKYRIDILPNILRTAYCRYKQQILQADEYHAEQEFEQRMDTINRFGHWMRRAEIISLNSPLFNPQPTKPHYL